MRFQRYSNGHLNRIRQKKPYPSFSGMENKESDMIKTHKRSNSDFFYILFTKSHYGATTRFQVRVDSYVPTLAVVASTSKESALLGNVRLNTPIPEPTFAFATSIVPLSMIMLSVILLDGKITEPVPT